MRISVIEGDSGYNTWQDLTRATVTLDGRPVTDVLTADEMLGFVLVYEKNYFGSYLYDEDGNLVTKKLRGCVVITFN